MISKIIQTVNPKGDVMMGEEEEKNVAAAADVERGFLMNLPELMTPSSPSIACGATRTHTTQKNVSAWKGPERQDKL